MTGTPIMHLSKKSTEEQTQKMLAHKPLARTPKVEFDAPVKRSHKKGVALPPGNNIFKRDGYVVGDGDHTYQVQRPGSEQHEQYPSATSAGEATYKDGHQ